MTSTALEEKKPGFPWGAVLSLLVGALLLFLVFRKIDFKEFSGALAQTRWGWIGVALLCCLLSHWFRGQRWVMLAEPLGHRPAALPTFYAVMSGYLANLALPRLGEITRCLLLARKTPLGFNALVGTVVMERLMDLLVLLLLSLAVLVAYSELLWDPVMAFLGARALGVGWFQGILVLSVLVLLPIMLWKLWGRWIPVPEKLRTMLRDFGQGMAGLWTLPNPGLFVVYTSLIWLGYFLMTYFCFFAFPGAEGLGLGDALLLLVAGAFGFVMPVQGGTGAYHAAIVWTLGRIPGAAMSASSALAFATLSHLAQTVLVVLVGGLCYFLMSLLPDHPKRIKAQGSVKASSSSKPMTSQEAQEQCAVWRAQGLKVVFTNGCFDLLHPGHLAVLQEAAMQGDRLVVGLNSDRSVSRLKGSARPVQQEEARAAILAALQVVDAVVIFGEDDPALLIEALQPDVLVKGGDYTLEQVVGAETVVANGGRVHLVPTLQGHSTTALIEQSNCR